MPLQPSCLAAACFDTCFETCFDTTCCLFLFLPWLNASRPPLPHPIPPPATPTSPLPPPHLQVVSFVYERGWRQGFAWAGFPGEAKEFELAMEYLTPEASGEVLVDMSCGSGLFTRRFLKSQRFRGVIAADFRRAQGGGGAPIGGGQAAEGRQGSLATSPGCCRRSP